MVDFHINIVLSRVGILWNPDITYDQSRLTSTREAARALGLTLVWVEARGLDALEQAFATMVREQMQALLVLADAVLFNYRGQIGVMALRNRLPAASSVREFAEAGLLLTYGSIYEIFIVAPPSSSTGFSRVRSLPTCRSSSRPSSSINLKSAKALGLTVPPTLLGRADEVIE